ncbi:MAG: exonuclease SbcCD subunit D [Anaerovoracaceae bacterium]
MKFVHLSDLHIGKKINDFSMLEEQKYILNEIYEIIKNISPDGVIIAGDIYDKQVPSNEAVKVMDDFLVDLANINTKVLLISGNHDSAERISFGARLMETSNVYMAKPYNGTVEKHRIEKDDVKCDIYMLPYIKPIHVRKYFENEDVITYNDAVKVVMDDLSLDTNNTNILIAHQFVTGAITSDSEEISIGGLDNVDGNLFNKFDYVALGHIHRPQQILRKEVRYAGSPLKYSFSESNHKKSITVLEVTKEGGIEIDLIPLEPRNDMREIKGSFDQIIGLQNSDDYMHITLTDEEDIIDGLTKLREIFPNLMRLDYDNTRTRENKQVKGIEIDNNKTILEIFNEFYELQNNKVLNNEQNRYLQDLIDKL